MSTPDERAQWIEECQGLVHSLAWQISRRLPARVEVEDLAGYGQIGLAQAANTFDAERGVRFSTFAYYRIRGAIHDGLTQMLWYRNRPVRELEFDRLANDALADNLEMEMADRTENGVAGEAQWFCDMAGRLATVFLLGGTLGAGDTPLELEDESAPNPISVVSRREISARLNEAIDSLPADGQSLIRTAYFENSSLQEAADRLGISRSWASRLHARTLKQLENALRQSGVDGA